MENDEKAPDSYFFGIPKVDNKVSAIDIGCDPIVDISINNTNQPSIISKKSVSREVLDSTVMLYHPSIPLDLPCQKEILVMDDFVSSSFIPSSINTEKIKSNALEQYNWLRKTYTKYLHRSLYDCSKGDNSAYEVHKYINETFDSVWHFGKYSRKMFEPRRKKKHDTFTVIADVMSDIPKNNLLEILDESLFMEFDEFKENYNLKNCLVMLQSGDRMFILCPNGPVMSDLSLKEIIVCDCYDNAVNSADFKMLKSIELFKISLNYRIKELISLDDGVVLARGDYSCTVFKMLVSADSVKLEKRQEYDFDKEVHSISINPLMKEELIVVAHDRSLTLVRAGCKALTIADGAFCDGIKWQSCLYGSSQQTCLVSNENQVVMYDFRLSPVKQKLYLELPSQFLNRLDKFSPVLSWSPMNDHHYIITSDQSIIFNDERYLKTPVLRINHYMKSGPRYMKVLPNFPAPNINSTLLTIGNYFDREIICAQLCSNNIEVTFSTDGNGNENILHSNRPITVREPLWKLSAYDEWMMYQNDWRFSLTDVTKRLVQPMIGLVTFPLTAQPNALSYSAVTQSLVGDIFFQRFMCETGNGNGNDRKLQAGFVEKKLLASEMYTNFLQFEGECFNRCNAWLDSVTNLKSRQNLNSIMVGENGDNIKKVDADSLNGETLKCLTIPDSVNTITEKRTCPVICPTTTLSDKQGLDSYGNGFIALDITEVENGLAELGDECVLGQYYETDTENATWSDCICRTCNDLVREKLISMKHDNNIISRKNLRMISEAKPLQLIENPVAFANPLSRVLFSNWTNEEYTPLDEFAPNVAFDPDLNTK